MLDMMCSFQATASSNLNTPFRVSEFNLYNAHLDHVKAAQTVAFETMAILNLWLWMSVRNSLTTLYFNRCFSKQLSIEICNHNSWKSVCKACAQSADLELKITHGLVIYSLGFTIDSLLCRCSPFPVLSTYYQNVSSVKP